MGTDKSTTWEIDRGRMRTVANNIFLHVHPTRVPRSALKFSYTWGLGGISTVLALMLIITGALLIFRYEPSVDKAYLSIQAIETEIAFGSLIRAIHHWSANLLLIASFLHLVRVLLTGGYKAGRATNYLIGLGLFLIVIAFNFTGYLLPWDQLAYWAITVGTGLLSYIPIAGPALSRYFLAGPEVGQAALDNFYAIHVAILPTLLIGMMTYHFWKIRKNGGITFPGISSKNGDSQKVVRVTTMPNLVQIELAAAAVIVTAVIIYSMVSPAPLQEIADPMNSPNPAKSAWYFAGIQELLLHIHPQAAMIFIGVLLASTALLPYFDSRDRDAGVYFRSTIGRRTAFLGLILGLDLVPILVVLDEIWFDLPGWMPTLETFVSTGVVPLAVSLLGLWIIYGGMRLGLKANRSEASLGVSVFLVVGLIMLTVIGVYFRGPNMALIWPF